eukprot:jgi/Psemu1/293378/fgenesh1_pg.2242_\
MENSTLSDTTDYASAKKNNGDAGHWSLDCILGLRCLSIVLSYLDECEGTSFLLCQKRYWTDTILPLLRLPPKSKATESISTETKKKKYRHRMSGRNCKPAVSIPDASTRLDRLNTRRWYSRRRRKCDSDECFDFDRVVDLENLTTALIAEIEWKETLTSQQQRAEEDAAEDDGTVRPSRRFRSIMNPPLLRFYDGQTAPGSHRPCFKDGITCLASYPRSGNTLLRSLLETATGFCTSSDTRPDRNLSIALAEKPPFFCGEGLAPSPSHTSSPFLPPQSFGGRNLLLPPPVCKTHWPERIGCHAYDCQRVVLLVRNPFDATDSYWHMSLTNTHTEKVAPSVTEEHLEFYRALVRHEILQVWMGFLDYYWKECLRYKIPLLLVRYEDLVLSPKRELRRILKFCCNSNGDDGGDWYTERLQEVTGDANRVSTSTDKARYGYQSSSTATDDSDDAAAAGTKVSSQLDLDGDEDDARELSISMANGGRSSMTINIPDVSLELRPRDSPYGRNMTYWRRNRTENDTQPFPTV